MATLTSSKIKVAKAFYQLASQICPGYNLKAIKAITAQAMTESNWGTSTLSSKYYNYFGMKCGSSWTGKSVNMSTKEEYTAGTVTNITANFRAYDSLADGIKGYCQFIVGMSRYKNLLGVTDNATYIKNIKNDGWATDSKYITTLTSVMNTLESNGVFSVAATQTSQPQTGTTYTTLYDSYIWSQPNANSTVVDLSKYKMTNNILPKGNKVQCTGITQSGKNVWIKCPLGYMPFYYNNTYMMQ